MNDATLVVRWWMLSALALIFALLSPSAAVTEIPTGPTPAAQLSTSGFVHHEVMRIDRDFGKDHWEIALDGWLPRGQAAGVAELRFWWVNTDQADHRKPFSATLSRRIDFGFAHRADGALDVKLGGDRKQYRFTVDLDDAGTPAVFADVRLADDTEVAHCRCHGGRLIARRLLGIPIGIASLRVHCTDTEGRTHQARVPHHET